MLFLQDYDSVKASLESSERIRKQQKELINLLQRSHSIGTAAAAAAGDAASVLSFNSISTISVKGDHGSHGSVDPGYKIDRHSVTAADIAVENREW
jgi:hypothetical protein